MNIKKDNSSNDTFDTTEGCADALDKADQLAEFRDHFHMPQTTQGHEEIYLCGNSLGLQPKITSEYVNRELEQWQKLGVKGHFSDAYPWMPYHEFLAEGSADLVGANPSEVVMMNGLTVNLHLMMVSFYQPTTLRRGIMIEEHAFPSDHYAVDSQLKFHGFDPAQDLLIMKPRKGESTLQTEDILIRIEQHAETLALIMLPGVQYYTGEVFDMQAIASKAQEYGIKVGFDLAHAVGNVPMNLHDWGVDFAVWCTYKYLNSGPGSVAGCFIHEKHHSDENLNRFAGWWGQDKSNRFQMGNLFQPIATAEGWQLSNPPILSLAAVRASLDVFKSAGGIQPLREKSLLLSAYLRYLLEKKCALTIAVLTPTDEDKHGCQLSLEVSDKNTDGKSVFDFLEAQAVTCDWREPNVIRIAPVPLYNSFKDIYRFVEILESAL